MKSKMWALLILGAAVLFFMLRPGPSHVHAAGGGNRDYGTGAPGGSAVAPHKFALLVAINIYKYPDRVSPLAGSVNDIEDMRQVLIGKFDFPVENILVLKDAQATHAGIIQAIRTHLIAKAQPGDIVVFQYSGHGSQMKDVTGKKASGLDETIVPYDSRDPEGKVFDISGTELHASLMQLAGRTKNLTFILDSCHSGTLVRGARVRFIPPDTRPVPQEIVSLTRGLNNAPAEASARFVSISAATSREDAFEHFADGQDHGALTYFLTRQLRSARAGATYRDVMDGVAGNVTANYPSQHPSLEGSGADQRIFGDAAVLAATYVVASPSLHDPKRMTLSVGQVQGATVGSTYDVYAPGTKRFAPPEKPVARVQLASVSAFTSEANVASGTKPAAASRAVEREHRYANARTKVYLDGVDQSPVMQAVREELNTAKSLSLVDRPTLCSIQLRQVGQSIQTLSADATTLSTPVNVNDPDAARKLVSQLQQWAKWFNVLGIRNAPEGISVGLALKGAESSHSAGTSIKPEMSLRAGQEVTVTLSNNSDRDLYVAMLDLSSDGTISVIYPEEKGTAEVLKPTLKLSRSFSTTVPNGRASVIDVLKVFVSYKPVDFTPLTQGTIRGIDATGDLDPLNELLIDSAGVSRGLTPPLSKPVDLGSWATLQRVLLVKRKG